MREFKNNQLPEYYQISIHLMNLITYFHPSNNDSLMKNSLDKNIVATTGSVIKVLVLLLKDIKMRDDVMSGRYFFPVHFRCAQLINHYGSDMIAKYLIDIYGTKKKSA